MTNDECQMTKEGLMTNNEGMRQRRRLVGISRTVRGRQFLPRLSFFARLWSFGLRHSFGIRHLALGISERACPSCAWASAKA